MIHYLRTKLNTVCSLISPPELDPPPTRKVLVIHCNPVKDSFSTAISQRVVSGLKTSGHEVKLRRLYVDDNESVDSYGNRSFSPVLTKEERLHHYYTNETFDVKLRDQTILEAIDDLKWCNAIVFVYPTWCVYILF